jgi:tetratricopeptide (TPR) repeat protein
MNRTATHLRLVAAIAALAISGMAAVPVQAQAVVQAPAAREAAELSAALRRLAARPADIDALVSAGNASLSMRDAGAAAGFFNRAAVVAPSDPRVLLGLARVALEQRRPVAALETFTRAERAGVPLLDMAADRALAYDLVGDNAAAQALYRTALAAHPGDDELRRRLALSLAISGARAEFERTLDPMLRKEDRAAYRTRAFGLAVLGRPDEAVAIADAMMPTDLALRMAPYLRYMPRLTKAQQAAAGNLGAFPAAAEIGRDSAEIAAYANAGVRITATADASLTPIGAPLGPRTETAATARQPTALSSAATNRDARQANGRPSVLASRPVAVSSAAAPPRPDMTPSTRPAIVSSTHALVSAAAAQANTPAVQQAAASRGPARPSVIDAFADLNVVTAPRAAAGAVDITALPPARRLAAATPAKTAAAMPVARTIAEKTKPRPKAEAPAEPARIWAQLGVGRNTAAFAFDWRRLAKQADGALDGKGPWAARYGATNRMLAGPYANDAAAKAAIKRLKDKGIEALPFNSDEGEKITKIG